MKISKKCQYALKAVFELAWRNSGKPVKIHEIATAQGISPRFTEIILNELKHAGFLESRRGNEGGYLLGRNPGDLNVGEVIECIQGPVSIAPDANNGEQDASIAGNEALKELWQEVNTVVSGVFTSRSFAELVEIERMKRDRRVPNWSI